jgi:hypothetical protein
LKELQSRRIMETMALIIILLGKKAYERFTRSRTLICLVSIVIVGRLVSWYNQRKTEFHYKMGSGHKVISDVLKNSKLTQMVR